MAKQTKFTIETESLLILRGRIGLRAWCPRCASLSEMIGLEASRVISNLMVPYIEESLASEDLHRSQAADGSPLICLNSLLRWVRDKQMK